MTWFTSDTHFNHAGILRHQRASRPFASIRDHDEALIRAWNDRVGPDDDIWHLGDFGHLKDLERLDAIFSRLHGHKRLILGNHDVDEEGTLKAETIGLLGWAETPTQMAEVVVETTRLVLCHYPLKSWHWRTKSIHLYGHVHGTIQGDGGSPEPERNGLGGSCDVGVDCWNLCPVSLPEIRRRIRSYRWDPTTLRAYENLEGA